MSVPVRYSSFLNFYPRPPRGGRPLRTFSSRAAGLFLSTPSARRATLWTRAATRFPANFYPRPPRGGRPKNLGSFDEYLTFLSTPSARRATSDGGRRSRPPIFLSTPSARRATVDDQQVSLVRVISIHALREEGDSCSRLSAFSIILNFYPRPPRGGRHDEDAVPAPA